MLRCSLRVVASSSGRIAMTSGSLVASTAHPRRLLRGSRSSTEPRRMLSIARQYSSRAAAAVARPSEKVVELAIPFNEGPVLRPYQEACVQECLLNLQAGITRIGVSSPTGSGKTTMFTSLLSRLPPLANEFGSSGTRVLIIVSSIELALQTARVVSQAHPDLLVEIEQGARYKASGAADVTVATYQTLHRSPARLDKFDPAGLKGVIVDEAHHAAAKAYRSVLEHFDPAVGKEAEAEEGEAGPSRPKTLSRTRPVPIIGFSATFARHDGLTLGKVFERIVFHKDFLEMIEEEWLSPVRFTAVHASIDLKAVTVSSASGDFTPTSLASVVNTPTVNRLIVRTWLDRAAGRRSTLVFCVNVAHVESLTQEFREAGIDARWMHGGTSMKERRQLLEDFRNAVFPVLVNCAILTEGADVPAIDCVLLARPTRSRNLFSQMIGRGMRLSAASGKKDCLILDLVGNLERGVVCTPTLFGLDPDLIDDSTLEDLRAQAEEEPGEAKMYADPNVPDPTKVTYEEWGPAELQQAMIGKSAAYGIVERMSANAWVDCGDDIYVMDLPPNLGYIRIERISESGKEAKWSSHFTPRNIDSDEAEAASGARAPAWPFSRSRKSNPFRRSRSILEAETLEAAIRGSDTYAESRVSRGERGASLLSRNAPWRARPASERQRAFVAKRLGLDKFAALMASADEDGVPVKRKTATDALPNLTKGQASTVLTRLQHGAKSRWEKQAREHNREVKAREKEEKRKARETVAVGPLPS